MRKYKITLLFLLLSFLTGPLAQAGWTRPTKKPTTAWQGFKDSANGAVEKVLPWNWFGERKPKYTSAAYSEYRDR